MKNIALLFLLLVLSCTKEEPVDPDVTVPPVVPEPPVTPVENRTPCEDGMAGIYPCLGYDLLAQVSLASFGSDAANDSWGWTDTQTGKEYVLMGLSDGTAFVDISDPEEPIILGKLATATSPSSWRDIKVYENHAFIVSEAEGHGLQVFDLTRLRDVSTPQNFNSDARLTDFGNAHNIWINESTGYAYVIGSGLFQGGPAFINMIPTRMMLKL